MLRIFPLNVRPDRPDYLQSRYGTLETIAVSRRVNAPYALPETTEDVEALPASLPEAFAKDFRFGLGLLWEYRSICEALGEQGQIALLVVNQGEEESFDPTMFVLGIQRFHAMRKEINRISARYQRDARRDKEHLAYHELHAADPAGFPKLSKSLRADTLFEATRGGRDHVVLSKRDRRASVGLVRTTSRHSLKRKPMRFCRSRARSSRSRCSSRSRVLPTCSTRPCPKCGGKAF